VKKLYYIYGFSIILAALLTALVYLAVTNSNNELALVKIQQHKQELLQHERDCDDLEVCLEAELSYSGQLDSCYPVDPLWGWPGDKTEELLTTCKLFKRIRRASGQ